MELIPKKEVTHQGLHRVSVRDVWNQIQKEFWTHIKGTYETSNDIWLWLKLWTEIRIVKIAIFTFG